MSEVRVNINHSTVNGAVMGINTTYNATPSQDAEVLRELQSIRRSLEHTEPMIADAVKDLQAAIENQDHPKISDTIRKLTSGFAASVITKVASESLLRYLGMK
ncbi:MAG: hypothetical protein IJQ81_05945 [Oscillibacter sp.]|nr:hypothetical protein [Oscillibacter sp.]